MKPFSIITLFRLGLLAIVLLFTRSYSYGQSSLKNAETTSNLLHFVAQVNDKSDELYVHFNPLATDLFDGAYDAYNITSLAGKLVPDVYTEDSTGVKYSINSFPFSGADKSIDMVFTFGSDGEVTITSSGTESFSQYPELGIYLLDTKTGDEISLRTNPSYTFSYSITDEVKRFKIRFIGLTAGLLSNKVKPSLCSVIINNKVINFQYFELQGKKGLAEIVDMSGRTIKNVILDGSGSQQVALPVSSGVYIVKVMFSGFNEIHKVTVR
jgi:hypothetical protein